MTEMNIVWTWIAELDLKSVVFVLLDVLFDCSVEYFCVGGLGVLLCVWEFSSVVILELRVDSRVEFEFSIGELALDDFWTSARVKFSVVFEGSVGGLRLGDQAKLGLESTRDREVDTRQKFEVFKVSKLHEVSFTSFDRNTRSLPRETSCPKF